MKYAILTAVAVLLASCGDVSKRPAIEEVQGALNPPVLGPVSPPLAKCNIGVPQGGFTIQGASPPSSTVRPFLSYPACVDTIAAYAPPNGCCLAEYSTYPLPDNREGMGFAMLWTYDSLWGAGRRWFDHPGPGYYAGSWADDIPLRTLTPGYPQSDQFIFAVNDGGAQGYAENSSIYWMTYLIQDFYALTKICSGPNMTGTCTYYGFNCPPGGSGFNRCHGDSDYERTNPNNVYTDFDIKAATADVNGIR